MDLTDSEQRMRYSLIRENKRSKYEGSVSQYRIINI